MSRHVIKCTHNDGKKLPAPVYWCGRVQKYREYCFADAGHVALAVGGSVQPCKSCIKAIIRELEKELQP